MFLNSPLAGITLAIHLLTFDQFAAQDCKCVTCFYMPFLYNTIEFALMYPKTRDASRFCHGRQKSHVELRFHYLYQQHTKVSSHITFLARLHGKSKVTLQVEIMLNLECSETILALAAH